MPFYRVGDSLVHLKMSGKGKKAPPLPCGARIPSRRVLDLQGRIVQRCMAISLYLCDWPLEAGGTCDAPMCDEHAHQVGANRHLCSLHLKMQREQQPELFE